MAKAKSFAVYSSSSSSRLIYFTVVDFVDCRKLS